MPSIFGREAELAALLDAVDRVPATGVIAVLVSGEAGIGKSSLLAEAVRVLQEDGRRVLAAESDDLGQRIPYAALTSALRAFGDLPGELDEVRRAALAAMDLTEPSTFGRSCELMARLLTGLTAAGPVALVLDDLDHVDDDSVSLLAVVLRRLSAAPLAVLAAARSYDRSDLPDRLERHAEVRRIALEPLSDDDIGHVVEVVLDSRVDEALAREVRRRADGNPFFATEIARSLRELDFVAIDGDRARLAVLPDAIRLTRADAVLRRVAPLDPDARAVARAVSILRRVRLDQIGLLATVASLPEA
ncbi:MAG: AAA family ATPase, partial [Umezawaea sp.]